jgi:1-acyl-sn-glycerol-3-phosphate acyltransferase
MLTLRVAFLFLLIAASTVVHVVPLLLVALVKALLPSQRLRVASNPWLTGLAESWIGVNNWIWDRFTDTRLTVREDAAPKVDGHYLVLANHQSWVDILVLQKVFNRRMPLLRFFLKRQLFWVPPWRAPGSRLPSMPSRARRTSTCSSPSPAALPLYWTQWARACTRSWT